MILTEICEAFANLQGVDHKELKSGVDFESFIPANCPHNLRFHGS